jgi:apolipoprotein N-acyltransferase
MASANNYQRFAAGLLTIGATATLFWFGNGLNPIWPLVWFAPLVACRRCDGIFLGVAR